MEHIKIVCKIPHEIALQDGFLSKLIRKMERQVKNTRKSPHMTIEITWGQQDQSEVISNVPITDFINGIIRKQDAKNEHRENITS